MGFGGADDQAYTEPTGTLPTQVGVGSRCTLASLQQASVGCQHLIACQLYHQHPLKVRKPWLVCDIFLWTRCRVLSGRMPLGTDLHSILTSDDLVHFWVLYAYLLHALFCDHVLSEGRKLGLSTHFCPDKGSPTLMYNRPVTVGDCATVCALNRSTLHDNCLRATLSACLSPTHGFSRLEQSTSYTPAS